MIWNIQNQKCIESGNLERESIETRKPDFLKEEYKNMRVLAKGLSWVLYSASGMLFDIKAVFFHQKISYCFLNSSIPEEQLAF